ncbi:hypothetical protein [Pedobacter insulae]|uniref:DUF4279 domain-containing protein n=1 Tax=Pedobacter insulae TaxID=414048 RepID=A0A1I3AQD9_9SPHI|nr:hypothetical protein [Pedobacter insulae]SFH51581.1 hypothetical protein SAMN04489864_11716 [Pedobacter insulae]
MCLLKVYSVTNSFKSFEKITKIPVYSTSEKGEQLGNESNNIRIDHKISFDVSEKDWDDFDGQVEDAIIFLAKHFDNLEQLFKTHNVTKAYLDFPIYSRLNTEIVNQNNNLPKELIVIAGKLNLGIEMAIYSIDAFDNE